MPRPLITVLLSVAVSTGAAHGQLLGPNIPDSLSIQGVLTDENGVVVPDGNYLLEFKLYDGPTVATQIIYGAVPVSNGIFDVLLGSPALRYVPFNNPLELGITVNGGTELTPRTPLASAAYAFAVRGMHAVAAASGESESMNVIAGASNNFVDDSVIGATIGGGGGVEEQAGGNIAYRLSGSPFADQGFTGSERVGSPVAVDVVPNSATGNWGTVGGGYSNSADVFGFVGGGRHNTASGGTATVVGGLTNSAGGTLSFVCGGFVNVASGAESVVAGGHQNEASGAFSAIFGGASNLAAGAYAIAAGAGASAGHDRTFVWDSKTGSTFSSGEAEQFLIRSGGGVGLNTSTTPQEWNMDDGDGDGDVISRFYNSASGTDMVVGIHGANYGLISVQSLDDLVFRTNGNERLRLTDFGLLGLGTSSPGAKLHVHHTNSTSVPQLRLSSTGSTGYARLRMHNGNSTPYRDIAAGDALNDELNFFSSTRGNVISLHSVGNPLVAFNGAHLTEGGAWMNGSSRDFKEELREVDARAVLESVTSLPVYRWKYKNSNEGDYMGPVAEDFFEAFELGRDDRFIGAVDGAGVALAAIQGLYELVKDQQAEIERLREIVQSR